MEDLQEVDSEVEVKDQLVEEEIVSPSIEVVRSLTVGRLEHSIGE
jgi:hypothetical protein